MARRAGAGAQEDVGRGGGAVEHEPDVQALALAGVDLQHEEVVSVLVLLQDEALSWQHDLACDPPQHALAAALGTAPAASTPSTAASAPSTCLPLTSGRVMRANDTGFPTRSAEKACTISLSSQSYATSQTTTTPSFPSHSVASFSASHAAVASR